MVNLGSCSALNSFHWCAHHTQTDHDSSPQCVRGKTLTPFCKVVRNKGGNHMKTPWGRRSPTYLFGLLVGLFEGVCFLWALADLRDRGAKVLFLVWWMTDSKGFGEKWRLVDFKHGYMRKIFIWVSHNCLLGSVTATMELSLSEYKKRARTVTSYRLNTAFGSAVALSGVPAVNLVLLVI